MSALIHCVGCASAGVDCVDQAVSSSGSGCLLADCANFCSPTAVAPVLSAPRPRSLALTCRLFSESGQKASLTIYLAPQLPTLPMLCGLALSAAWPCK